MNTVLKSTVSGSIIKHALQHFVSFDTKTLELMEALRQHILLKRFAILVQAKRRINQNCNETSKQTGFDLFYEIIRSKLKTTQKKICIDPSFSLWCDTLSQLLSRNADINLPEFHLGSHLEDLSRFALASVIIEKGNTAINVRLDINGRLILPVIGKFAEFGKEKACENILIRSHFGKIIYQNTTIPLKCLAKIENGIVLNDLDTTMRRCPEVFTFTELNIEEANLWRQSIDEACKIIKGTDSKCEREISKTIKVIIPIGASENEVHESSSLPQAFGAIYLSYTNRRDALVEALIHEYFHNRFNALMESERIFADDTETSECFSRGKVNHVLS